MKLLVRAVARARDRHNQAAAGRQHAAQIGQQVAGRYGAAGDAQSGLQYAGETFARMHRTARAGQHDVLGARNQRLRQNGRGGRAGEQGGGVAPGLRLLQDFAQRVRIARPLLFPGAAGEKPSEFDRRR